MTRVVTLTTLLAVCLGAPVSAQPLEVSQYAHTAWRYDAWSPEVSLRGSGQTPDGYLWFVAEARGMGRRTR